MSRRLEAVGLGGWSHFWAGLAPATRQFVVRRTMVCSVGHAVMPVLVFDDWGATLANGDALMCPRCGRELGLL